ncbi:hypothetical protein BAUCODRAFT_48043, partial [Baudoinia panamericana UAMH 10762]
EDDEAEDEDEEEPDEEEIREKKKKARKVKATAPKKPAQKKPRVNGATLPIRNAPGAAKKRAPKKLRALNAADAEAVGGLFAEVYGGGAALQDVAGKWLKRFEAHESSALAEVVNLVLRCAGCEAEVTDDDIGDPDGVTNRLEDLRDEYQRTNPTDYPLIAKGKAGTTYRQGLVGFFDAMIKTIAVKGTLYDNDVLLQNIQIWVSTMSSAPNRSFRHTATVASLAIVTALCDVARENAEAAANSQRQAETERKKPRSNKQRAKDFDETVKIKTRALESVELLLKDWFDVVFIHRYRDIDPNIRRDCVAALGDWIAILPDVFFDGQHLRYLGWVLSDPAAATRSEVIKQLSRFYKNKDMSGGLKTFTEKFRSRLVEIATTDAEIAVRVAAIELVDVLREHGMLEPDDIDAIGGMIYDTEPRVRKAVAAFFAAIVLDLHESKLADLGGRSELEEALPETANEHYEVPRLEWLELKSLAEMLRTYATVGELPSQIERSKGSGVSVLDLSSGESRFTLAADALYDKLETSQAWQMLAGYLLFDHSSGRGNGVANDSLSHLKNECVLTEGEETILLAVLNASVRHTLSDIAEKIQAPKHKPSAREKAELQEELEEAARHLAATLPKLLKKFGDAPSTAAAVLRIESVLSMPILHDLQQDSATYTTLLDDVRKQFMSHGTDEVLAPASNAILHAKSYGELNDIAEEKITGLWDDVINNLTQLLNPATLTVRGASQSEELTALSNNLLRIIHLARVSDCSPYLEDTTFAAPGGNSDEAYQGAIDYIIALIQRGVLVSGLAPDAEEAALEDQIALRAAEAALFYLRWKLNTIKSTVTKSSSVGISLDDLEVLATRRDSLVANLESVLNARKPVEGVSTAMAGCLLDLYASAAILRDIKPKPGMSDDYIVLVMDLTPELEKAVMHVFAACEKNYAKLSGKRIDETAADGAETASVDGDPMSDPESDDEEDDQDAQSQQRREAKQIATLTAEHKLCELTGKIIHTLAAGVMTDGAVRKRLERNKDTLGHNYKAVVAYLDMDSMHEKHAKRGRPKGKGKGKAQTNGAARSKKVAPKSNAIIAEDEMEEDMDDDADDEEALRRRELAEPEPEPEEEDQAVDGASQDAESVLGD